MKATPSNDEREAEQEDCMSGPSMAAEMLNEAMAQAGFA